MSYSRTGRASARRPAPRRAPARGSTYRSASRRSAYGRRPAARRGPTPKVMAGVGIALAALLGVGLWIIQKPAPTVAGRIAVLINEDANTAGNGLDQIRDAVTTAAIELSDEGGGDLVIAKAAGDEARQVATADLRIVDPDGQAEHDEQTKLTVAGKRIEDAFAAAETAAATGNGRNLASLLTMAARLAPASGQSYQVYVVGFGLGTVDPADARVQMGGDPSQAVEEMKNSLPSLRGATINLVFPSAVEPQPALNTLTASWRDAYWKALAGAMGARLGTVQNVNVAGPAVAGAPTAPVIPNLENPTVVPPPTTTKAAPAPKASAKPAPEPQPAPVILAGTVFVPDQPQFVDPAAAKKQLSPLAAAWKNYKGRYESVDCVGRTAKFGDAATARILSEQRASTAQTALKALGVATVHATGVGFDDPLPDIEPTAAGQRSVSCTLVPKTQD